MMLVWYCVFAVLLIPLIYDNWHVSALSFGKPGAQRGGGISKSLFRTMHRGFHRQPTLMATAESTEPPLILQRIVVDGFFSKAANFANPLTTGKLYEKVCLQRAGMTSLCIVARNACILLSSLARNFCYKINYE
jgi:hypothetical protein